MLLHFKVFINLYGYVRIMAIVHHHDDLAEHSALAKCPDSREFLLLSY